MLIFRGILFALLLGGFALTAYGAYVLAALSAGQPWPYYAQTLGFAAGYAAAAGASLYGCWAVATGSTGR